MRAVCLVRARGSCSLPVAYEGMASFVTMAAHTSLVARAVGTYTLAHAAYDEGPPRADTDVMRCGCDGLLTHPCCVCLPTETRHLVIQPEPLDRLHALAKDRHPTIAAWARDAVYTVTQLGYSL